jgi:hypothetical protein
MTHDTTPTSVPNITPQMAARLAYKRMQDQDRKDFYFLLKFAFALIIGLVAYWIW